MAVKVTVECPGGNILASVETARPDIAAQIVYEVSQTALNDDCDCGVDVTALIDEMLAQDDLYAEEEEQEDPNYYDNRHNGLPVEESARRAAEKVTGILQREREVSLEEQDNYVEPICLQAISLGTPRNVLYRLAGTVAKEAREENYYIGVPLALAFQLKVLDEIGMGIGSAA